MALRHTDFLVDVNATFFNVKLKELIEDSFKSPGDFDLIDNELKTNRLIGICQRSKIAFCHFARVIAQQMIKYNFSTDLQSFLDHFLQQMQLNLSRDDFLEMYDAQLISYALICDVAQLNSGDGAAKNAVENCLRALKQTNHEHFIILCTHFPMFLYLLKTKC